MKRRLANRRSQSPGKVVFQTAVFLLIVLDVFVTSSGLFGNVLLSEMFHFMKLKVTFYHFLSIDSVHGRTVIMQQLKQREPHGGLWDFPHCKQE